MFSTFLMHYSRQLSDAERAIIAIMVMLIVMCYHLLHPARMNNRKC